MDEANTDRRLESLEARLARVETLLAALVERIAAVLPAPAGDRAGPVLPGTRIPCTDEVLDRLRRVAVPFVREMVARKVADCARAERVPLVDVAFFERAATF
jgi:hypothetical protein